MSLHHYSCRDFTTRAVNLFIISVYNYYYTTQFINPFTKKNSQEGYNIIINYMNG